MAAVCYNVRNGKNVVTPIPFQGEWFPYLLVACATWRITHLFMYEAGPWDLVLSLRSALGVRHDDDGHPDAYPQGSVFACFLCFSVWAGLVLTVLPWFVSIPFALSAVAIWVEHLYGSR